MANRYWVGGSGTWDNSTTTRWSATSGGSGGASAPTSADAVFFNASSGGGTVTIASTAVCLSVTFTGFTGTLAFGTNWLPVHGTGAVITTADADTLGDITGTGGCDLVTATASSRTVSIVSTGNDNKLNVRVSAGSGSVVATGASFAHLEFTSGFSGSLANGTRTVVSLTLSTSMTTAAGSLVTTVKASAYNNASTITTNGCTLNFSLTLDPTGTYDQDLAGALTLATSYTLSILRGVFNTNDYTITAGSISVSDSSARTLNLGASVITLSGSGTAWNATTVSGLTLNAGTSIISLTSASSKTFIGGGMTYNTLRQGGAGTLTITGSNTFGDIDDVANGSTVRLTAGTTQTVSNLSLAGASGSLVTLDSTTPGSPATISKASGTVTALYLSVKDITATGGATWVFGTGSIDVSGNTGWGVGSLSNPAFLQFF